MASGRAADREDPNNSKRRAARSLDRDPTSELYQGQRSDAPHQRAGHMTAPDHFAETLLNILRRRGPSTYALHCAEVMRASQGGRSYALTLFGLFAVSATLACYALVSRSIGSCRCSRSRALSAQHKGLTVSRPGSSVIP
jgi:hypothetical protein